MEKQARKEAPLPRRNRPIPIHPDIDRTKRAIPWAGGVGEAVEGIEDGAVRRAVKLLLAALIVDGDTGVGAGSFTGDKVAVREMYEQATLAIGGIGEGYSRVGGLVGVADHGAGMRWRWRGRRRRLRRLRRRL